MPKIMSGEITEAQRDKISQNARDLIANSIEAVIGTVPSDTIGRETASVMIQAILHELGSSTAFETSDFIQGILTQMGIQVGGGTSDETAAAWYMTCRGHFADGFAWGIDIRRGRA